MSPQSFPHFMKADERPHAALPLDVSPLLGHWFNTLEDTAYLAEVEIGQRDGALWMRAFGSSDSRPLDWGETKAVPYGGGTSAHAGGFLANYAQQGIETQLVANQKLGVLVIQSYTRYLDGSGRGSHFAREFFHR